MLITMGTFVVIALLNRYTYRCMDLSFANWRKSEYLIGSPLNGDFI